MTRSLPASGLCIAAVVATALALLPTTGVAGEEAWSGATRVSVSSSGRQADGSSSGPTISASGRYVAFGSNAPNLVQGDTNNNFDIFLRDRLTGRTVRVSVGPHGQQADDASSEEALSADGRFVAFTSYASNLTPGRDGSSPDVFVRDLARGVTRLVSVGRHGTPADNDSTGPAISADGRYVAFTSRADNLVAGDTNGARDVFVRDMLSGVTRRVSVGPHGAQADGDSTEPTISADGRFVAFTSVADNLVPGDSNGVQDVFVRDLLTRQTRRVSVAAGGGPANGQSLEAALSGDGRFVAFTSDASNLVTGDTNGFSDIFLRDLVTGVTQRVSVGRAGRQATDSSFQPGISADGRYVVFTSYAANLVTGDSNGQADVFVRDVLAASTTRVSVSSTGRQGNESSFLPSISADGRHVAFTSDASNLVPRDSNDSNDVFAVDQPGDTARPAAGAHR